jgi:putative polyhydroxyalkanoate system protein
MGYPEGMRVTVTHNTTKAKARQKVEQRLDSLQSQYGHYASDIQKNWQGDRLDFELKAKGFTGKGTVEVTDTEVIIDGKLPLIARPFEPRIKSTIEQEMAAIFGKA